MNESLEKLAAFCLTICTFLHASLSKMMTFPEFLITEQAMFESSSLICCKILGCNLVL